MTITASRMARFRSELEEEESRKSKNFIKFPWFTPPQNKQIKVRVLPGIEPEDPEREFYVKVVQHFNVSPSKKIPVTCPKTKVSGADCPVCQRVAALYKAGTDQDKKQAKFIKQRTKYAMAVIPQEGEDAGKIMVWMAPKQAKDAIINYFAIPEYGDITDLRTGRDVYITKTGEDIDTDYALLAVPAASAMSENEDELAALKAALPPLFYLRNAASLDNIRKYMSGESENIMQGFSTAPSTEDVAVAQGNAEEGAFTPVSVPQDTVPESTVVEPHKAFLPASVLALANPDTAVAPAVVTPAPAPAPAPAPVAAPAVKKFDLGAIQAQIAKINNKK